MLLLNSQKQNRWRGLLYCGRVPAANAHGCTAAEGLLYAPWSLVVPTCTARCLHQRPYQWKEELLGREMANEFCLKIPDFHVTFKDLLDALNLRHGTNGFTSLPKEGVLRISSPWKIRRLWPGLNPRTWVPKASTLPLEHRSRSWHGLSHYCTASCHVNERQFFLNTRVCQIRSCC